MKEEYYQTEIVKLLAILQQDKTNKDIMITRVYVIEKLERIINGTGIGIHPSLEEWVESYCKKQNINR